MPSVHRVAYFLITLVHFLIAAVGARFATFSVEPFGTQRVNLDTGITVLPQGGILTDNTTGLKISAKYAEYKTDSFIYAKEAEIFLNGYAISAREFHLDLSSEKLAIKEVLLKGEPFRNLSAKEAHLFLEAGILLLRKEVSLSSPELRADLAVVNLRAKHALVLGPFSFTGEGEKLQSTSPNGRLFLFLQGSSVKGSTRIPKAAATLEAWARRVP